MGITDVILFKTIGKNKLKLKKDYAEFISETTGIEIQSQHWGGNRKLTCSRFWRSVFGYRAVYLKFDFLNGRHWQFEWFKVHHWQLRPHIPQCVWYMFLKGV